jgi:hypothetical protein
VHQRVHEVSINVEEQYALVRCGEDITIYDEIPDYCARCGEPL